MDQLTAPRQVAAEPLPLAGTRVPVAITFATSVAVVSGASMALSRLREVA